MSRCRSWARSGCPTAATCARRSRRSATQFFGFLHGIASSAADGADIRLSPALVQPVAADDVAGTLAELAVGAPVNGTAELGGPERMPLAALVQRYLRASEGDEPAHPVIVDPGARSFGARLFPGGRRGRPDRYHAWHRAAATLGRDERAAADLDAVGEHL